MDAPYEKRPPPPSWINREFIEPAIQIKEQKNVTINSMSVKSASVEGSGYTSLIFRITVSLKDNDCEEGRKESVLIKTTHEFGKMKELVESTDLFRIESLMLHEVMPQIHESLRSVEGDAFWPLAAQCYQWGQQPRKFLVLEDLAAAGFKTTELGHPLDYQHCVLVMRAYARLHAASVLLLKNQPRYKETFVSNMFTNTGAQEYFRLTTPKIFCALATELDKCPGYEKYSEKCRTNGEKIFNNVLETMVNIRNETKLPVLTHGDCWKNNMMFKNVDGTASEVRLVDFQLSAVTSPAADLQYFLYANAREDVHRHHMDSLLAEYHSCLLDLLKRLGMEMEAAAYTFQELMLDMDRCSSIGVFFSSMSGFILTSEKYGAEFAKMVDDPEHSDEGFAMIYRNPYSLSYMKYLIPIFISKGLL